MMTSRGAESAEVGGSGWGTCCYPAGVQGSDGEQQQ